MQDGKVQGFRLSPQQRRVWWLQQTAGRAPFQVQVVVRIDGEIGADQLESAVRAVVAKTEILRTGFPRLRGMALPLQVVDEQPSPVCREWPLAGLVAREREEAIQRLLREEWETPYDPERDSPLRLLRIGLAPESCLLALTLQALCTDRIGAVNVVREIARVCREGDQAAPDMQYVDLAEWQNELLEADETEAGRKHWAACEVPAAGGLGCELPNSNGEPFVPALLPVALRPAVTAQLEALARVEGISVASFLLATWSLLLARWRGGETPCLGLACDGRRYRELADAVGPFARVLPLRGASGAASLRTAARQIQIAARQARAFQESFDWEKVSADRGEASGRVYLPWVFSCEDAHGALFTKGTRFTIEAMRDTLERFDLHLAVIQRDDAIEAELRYDRSRFDPADAERLGSQFTSFVERLVDRPDVAADDVPVTSDTERRELLDMASGGSLPEPDGVGVHELISRQAGRTPDAPAVVSGDLVLTYAELERRASRLARRLRLLAIGPEVRVALFTERSADAIVGLLGILKAGAAYVPIEPRQPKARIARMLTAVSAVAVVAQRSVVGELPGGSWSVLCLEDVVAEGAAQPPTSAVMPGNLAYVMFTSGSTGRPKGVAVEHRQLLNYVRAVMARLELRPGMVFATVSTFAADLGHTMVFPALCGGGCLRIVAPDHARDAAALADLFEKHPADCLKVTPSHLSALLGTAGSESVLPRCRLVLGGEASRPELLRRIDAQAPRCGVFNHYGPTETTVGVLTHAYTAHEWDVRWATLPLGRPLSGARVYVLDGCRQLAPYWVAGEVYVGGAAVARGYLGEPALTAEKFVPNPVGGVHGERLYRTGDLARTLPGAGIEFLGRVDHQVKIRGFRIELGEIEGQIRRHPGVRETVVLAREEGADRRLVAYVVASQDVSLTAETLRNSLAEELPDYMVPAAFVMLSSLPLTANGKIDRKALPAADSACDRRALVPPRTAVEELLVGLWAQLMRRDDIGVEDSFFELGGHSLLATQLFSRIRETFRVELPINVLFESPTIAALAAKVEAALLTGAGVQTAPIVPVPRETYPPLSFAQGRHWVMQQLDPTGSLFNMRISLRLEGDLDVDVLERCVGQVLTRHEMLRTSFPVIDGQPVQVIAPALDFHIPVADLRELPPAERHETARRLMKRLRGLSFDLARLPLLRVVLLQMDEAEHLLVMTLHHIIADGWSLGVLVRELTALYPAFVACRPSPLPPVTVQYADFSQWQHELMRSGVMATHLDYWRRQLDGAPGLRLPLDLPRPSVPSGRSRRQPLNIPAGLSEQLRATARDGDATLFHILLAAFHILLHDCSGQTDIVVGTPVANRNRLEIEGLIGCLINAVPLRCDLSGNPTFRELLTRVRRGVLDAHAHEDLPFDKLVEELNPSRADGHTPFFEVVFSYGTPRQPLVVPGLTITPVDIENEADAKYDLMLLVSPTAEKIEGNLTYSTDLFKPATVVRMAGRFEALLRAVVARPDATLRELVASADESERLTSLARAQELKQARRGLLAVERRTLRPA